MALFSCTFFVEVIENLCRFTRIGISRIWFFKHKKLGTNKAINYDNWKMNLQQIQLWDYRRSISSKQKFLPTTIRLWRRKNTPIYPNFHFLLKFQETNSPKISKNCFNPSPNPIWQKMKNSSIEIRKSRKKVEKFWD